jgi:putative membrane protein
MKNFSEKSWFKYVVIIAVLFIPFMYAFFYLKAYWNPYGEGNMDNIPVAIVNMDNGSMGEKFATKLIDSDKLNFQVVSSEEANSGLSDKDYYAVISIPSDFSSNLESAGSNEKVSTTITYAPNQKTNYLASQIISRVLVVAEEELRGEVSSTVVDGLSEKLRDIPDKMSELSNGASKLNDGASKLNDGINTLNGMYSEFDSGINTLYNGSISLNSGINEINNGVGSLNSGFNHLVSGINQINSALSTVDVDKLGALSTGISTLDAGYNGTSGLASGINNYVNGANAVSSGVINLDANLDKMINDYSILYSNATDDITRAQLMGTIGALKNIKASINADGGSLVAGANSLISSSSSIVNGVSSIGTGISSLNSVSGDIVSLGTGISSLKSNMNALGIGADSLSSGLNKLSFGTDSLYRGSVSLNNGLGTLSSSSKEVKSALDSLSSGSSQLYDGINTLKSSVDSSISSSNEELSKLDGLSDFVKDSVTIKEEAVNSVSSYGTAFGPFFMSIALWVGSLMLFIILYYDASDRFGVLSRNASNKFLRTSCYLGLASLQGISLGVLLMLGLDLTITNYFLYFISLILVACFFESIMEFLIVNFGDIGKFLSLILLVLQLSAAGGTFPIETVTRSFRFLNPLLPMKYTCDLFKETIISLEGTLVFKSMSVVIVCFVILLGFNLYKDYKSSRV